ncbi:BQ2448_2924 [Microbotryum intermedium]|uniref:BQ2448_2924 protein n=1 Tax=Microbotryum intermedium TaxID=269621 RepID=A0A238FJT4_9BASI|nr:BQ2448_2924 [Microbotryum intermedium]
MRVPVVVFAIATAGAFAASSAAQKQRGSSGCEWTCQHGPRGYAKSRSSVEFKTCLATYCSTGEEGLDACYKVEQAAECVKAQCPSGPHFDYLGVELSPFRSDNRLGYLLLLHTVSTLGGGNRADLASMGQ